jgi:methylated-DNA-[protein]-cysteine S-methyltransferase
MPSLGLESPVGPLIVTEGKGAIGGACGANPIPIIIPCHRVLASGGRPGGYSGRGGLETKRFLLAQEAALGGPGRPWRHDPERSAAARVTTIRGAR